MIAQFKKRPAWLALPAVAALVAVTACTLTTAQTSSTSTSPASVPNPTGYDSASDAKPNSQSVTGTYTLHDMNLQSARALVQRISPKSILVTKSERSHDIEIIAPSAEQLQAITDALAKGERAAQDALPTLRAASDKLKNDQASLAQRQSELQQQAEVMEQQQVVRQQQVEALMADRRKEGKGSTAVSADPVHSIIIEEINCEKIPLNDVITYLHDRTGLNIIANWRAIQAAGFDKNFQVTLHLTHVPLQKVLNTLLADISPDLTWSFEDNVLTISTRADLSTHVRTEIYNVRDLLASTIHTTLQIPAGGVAQVQGRGFFGGETTPAIPTPVPPPPGYTDDTSVPLPPGYAGGPHAHTETTAVPGINPDPKDVNTLVEIIQSTCDSNTWKDHGGAIGTVLAYHGLLTITTTPEIHDKIHNVLEDLRAADKQAAH